MIVLERPEQSFEASAPVSLARRILVVIPVLNEEQHIEACIRSLLQEAPDAEDLQVVVADGGSTDETREIVTRLKAAFPCLDLIENPGRIQAAAVNAGAEYGESARDILVRCDAHADYPPNFIFDVAASLLRQGSDSLVVPMDARGLSCFQKANAWVVDTPLGSGGSPHRGGRTSGYVDHGHHAAFRRDFFLALGGYDETFSHNEDAEYDARVCKAGGSVYLDADIRIGYYPRASLPALWRQYAGYGAGRARNLTKHKALPRLRQLLPVLNLLLLAASLLLAFWSSSALVWPILYAAVLGCVSFWLLLRHRSLCGLWGGVALGVMHLAWATGFLRSLVVERGGSRP